MDMDNDPDIATVSEFCQSPFWDDNLTWNSSWPQFTDCFQKTALTGGPCALLWGLSLFYGYSLLHSPDNVLPASRLFSSKMIASTTLALLTIFELTQLVLDHGSFIDLAQLPITAEFFSPAALLLTLALTTALARLEHQKGVRTSILLCLFWLALLLGQLVPFYTILLDQVYRTEPMNCLLFYAKFAVILFHLYLYCLAERPGDDLPSDARKPCPDPDEPLWSRLSFSWIKEFLDKGSKRDLTEKDIYLLLPAEQSGSIMPKFSPVWKKEVEKANCKNKADTKDKVEEDPEQLLDRLLGEQKANRKNRRLHKRTKSMEFKKEKIPFLRSQSEFQYTKESDSLLLPEDKPEIRAEEKDDSEKKKTESTEKSKSRAKPSFLMGLIRSFGVEFSLKQLLQLVMTFFDMVDPIIFGLLLEFMENKSAPTWRGFFICSIMMASKMSQAILRVRSNYWNHCFAIRIKSSIVNTVFNKALTMDTESRQESTVGQAVNLISVDAGDVCHAFTWMAPEMIYVPVRIIVSLFMLYRLLGPSMLFSVVMLTAMIPINSYAARKLSTMHKSSMDQKDERLKILTEVINGVKILKMYAWEPSFIKKVNDARSKELDVMWWRSFWEAAMHFYWTVAPYMVSVTVLLMYVYSSEDHYLAPSIAFVALSLIDKLRGAMGTLPHIISHFVKVRVSFQRLNEFLGRTDLDDDVKSDEDDVISIKSGSFSWSSEAAPTLKNINLRVKKGSLVAVVGTVGSGKSSLVSACLGEMKKLKGHVSIKGSIAYVPQQAWIQHATLKDNVLFGQDLNDDLYNQCLDNCALRPDLETLPGGDLTEIGEKGINISGGQKQRVSLARAVYSQADLYLLDDPLSAVDCHVGTHIFNKVVGHQGMLAGKTRVLVTHGVQWLPMVDQIIVIRHGRVSEVGSYEELLTHDGPFAKFLKHYLAHASESGETNQAVEKLKMDILHRLDSIPKDLKSNPSVKHEDSGSSTESSSSDNESIVQELIRSASLEQATHDEQADSEQSVDEDVKNEKCDESKNEKNLTDGNATLVEDEDYKVQQVKLSMFKDYALSIGYGWVLVLVSLITIQQTAERGSELSLSHWTDDPLLNNLTALPADSTDRIHLNNHYLMLYTGFGVLHAITTMAFKITLLMRKVVTARVLHGKMVSRVLRAPMTFFDTTPVGRIVHRFSSDLNTVDSNLPHTMEWALYCFLIITGKLLIVCYMTPTFVLLTVPIALLFTYVQHFFVPTMRQLERLRSKVNSPIYSYFSETLNGTAVVRAFGAQKRFIEEFQRRYDLLQSVEFNWGNCNKWLTFRMESIGTLVIFGVVISAITFRDNMTAGMVGLAVSLALDITDSLHGVCHMVSWLQTQLISVDRVKQYCEMDVEADWRKEESAPSASWPEKGEIRIADLVLRYRDGPLVLKGVNVNIKAGQKVGIVGRTGAGKSSLTLGLFRLIEPTGGKVIIDDLSTSDLGLHDLRSRLTILPQDPVIFAGSLRMNLDPFAHYTDGELWEALKHAHLSDFVSNLKEELDHECGEGGENLSVGQRQLLCLARTLLHKTRVLVLDEATAAVDMETDDLIQRTIRSEFKDCTVLTIAHRLNTVIDYDRILVLDKGQVVEYDSPDNLMNDPTTIFHDMAKKTGLLNKKS